MCGKKGTNAGTVEDTLGSAGGGYVRCVRVLLGWRLPGFGREKAGYFGEATGDNRQSPALLALALFGPARISWV